MPDEQEPSSTSPAAVVWLVEGDAEFARDFTTALAPLALAVRVSADGADAVRRARAEAFDLLVVDMLLPGASGFRVLEEVRAARGPGVPVLMLSAYAANEHHDYALALGADQFLPKSAPTDHLLTTVLDLLTAPR